jgi:hypothetical protein
MFRCEGATPATFDGQGSNSMTLVELVGLEPTTSWVRSRRSSPANVADVQGFYIRADPTFLAGIAADIRPILVVSGTLGDECLKSGRRVEPVPSRVRRQE